MTGPMFVLVPPLTVARKRKYNMHQALFIPEILLIIFKHVTDDSGQPLFPTFAAIARTCRSFQRHVEEILWRELPSVSVLHNILPLQVRNKASRGWPLSRRAFSGTDWKRFMDRASRVRVLAENGGSRHGLYERSSAVFLAMATLRNPPLLTPNLRKLEWQANHRIPNSAINLFISPSLISLEIDAKLLTHRVIRVPLGDTCPNLQHLKITGNGRSSAGTISSVLRGLYRLETLICSTLDDDAFVHLAELQSLSYLAIDMRWSELSLDAIRDRLHPDSFRSLRTLYWKDYGLDMLADILLMPDVRLSDVHLEIEAFCTSSSLRTFLQSFTAKFPYTQAFSLVHDTQAGRRFGLQVSTPGREHQLDPCDLEPLLELKSLRVLNLVDLGHLQLDDDFIKMAASAWPELEQLYIATDGTEHASSLVTFDGLLALLRHCPKLRSLGLYIDARDMLSYGDTTVRHDRVTHLRLEGSILRSCRAEVDEMLRRVLPRLKTVEERLDGMTRCVRDVCEMGNGAKTSMGRRTRNSLEGARGG